MKRFLAVLLASTILFSTSVFADGMRYVCNNNEVNVTAETIFKDGIVFLPVAQICKALGYKVIEKESNNSVTAEVKTKPGYFSVFLGKSKGRMNGQDISLAKAPFKENGVIYVSSRLIEEQLGVSVSYDSSKNTVYINNKGEGEITSTVGKAPAAKSAVSVSSTASNSIAKTSNSSYKTYPNSIIPDFAEVTGCNSANFDSDVIITSIGKNNYYARVIDSSGNIIGMRYNYKDATDESVNKYIQTLINLGFSKDKKYNNIYRKNNSGVEIQYGNGLSGYYVTIIVPYI